MTFKPAAWPRKLRLQEWFGGTHPDWMKYQSLPRDLVDGCPVEVSVVSASKSACHPTAMVFRNLAAMAVEVAAP